VSKATKRILLVGGGSGGHIIPLISIIQELQKAAPEIEYAYVGSPEDMRSSLVRDEPLLNRTERATRYAVRSGKLNRFLTWKHIGQAYNLVMGLKDAGRALDSFQPDIVVSKGGAVSVPVARAAYKRNIPIYCHETDVRPGLANRIVGKMAKSIFTSYPLKVYSPEIQAKGIYVGQPVRAAFFGPDSGKDLTIDDKRVEDDLPLLFVTGGSHGARKINYLIQSAWPALLSRARLVQQTGTLDFAELQRMAGSLSPELRQRLHLTALLTEGMPELCKRSSVVISRAGGFIAELAAAKAAVILIPLSTSAQNHQWANAEVLEAAGAAIVLDEVRCTPELLAETILKLLENSKENSRLRTQISTLARPQAAAEIVRLLLSQLNEGHATPRS
jgi:UDP-N-acetylglucosamine--N-acetylmuramyl-(pentapeptide) pyrophosphoryl-undecaprenol N-acetylglucosamine transferase